jgi:FkbM family methyltransferase
MAVRDRYVDIRRHITAPQPLIIDGGASTGNTSRQFVQDYPQAQIHAFEPIPAALEKLKAALAGSPNVQIHPKALGASNQSMTFHVLQRHTSSSLLSPTSLNLHYHPDEMQLAQDIQVEMVRLDSVFQQSADLLKLDLQGYELEALKGAGEWLQQVKIITTEVEFVPLYEGQPLFSEIELYLRERGFYLFNLYELWTHPDGQLTAGDAVFFNQRYFDPRGR